MRFEKVNLEITPLVGGMDMVTTPALVKPGRVLSAVNFEPDIFGGYRRMKGIERYDGRIAPSSASYYVASCNITSSVEAGNTITGATSGASAKVLHVVSNSEIILTKVVGVFVSETINISGSPQGTINSVDQDAALTGELHAKYKSLAANEYRSNITKVPGLGPVTGINYYKGNLYAFRDNVSQNACVMYKDTPSGWVAVQFGYEVQFDTSSGEIFEGNTVTGSVSGATAVVKRSLLRTGTWTTSGVGTLVFDSITGAFQDNEILSVGGANKAIVNGSSSQIKLLPGGRWDFDNINFVGNTDGLRMYGVDGVNEIGEFDGTRWVPIRTGIQGKEPRFISGHKNHLFVAIESSLQHSGIGNPYSWTALTGAAELALGEDCEGILPQTGDSTSGALVAATKKKMFILYGTDSANWNLVLHSPDSGARAYTMQNIGFAHFLDTKGVTQLVTSQAFGGFQLNVLTQAIQPIIDQKVGTEKASCIVRGVNQYRLFFDDGTGLIMQIIPNSNALSTRFGAIMPFDYGAERAMNIVHSAIDANGKERIFGAGIDGYVYELDKGTSLDGDPITYHFMTVFNNSKSLRVRKHYYRTVLQFRAENTVDIDVGYDLSYGNLSPSYGDSVSIGDVITKKVQGVGGYWDSFNWDNFTWDASYAQELNIDTKGNGDSMALIVSGESDEVEPFTIHTVQTHYTHRRQNR